MPVRVRARRAISRRRFILAVIVCVGLGAFSPPLSAQDAGGDVSPPHPSTPIPNPSALPPGTLSSPDIFPPLAQVTEPQLRRRPELSEVRTKPLFIPLPAVSASPNKGNEFGLLPVLLFFDDQGKVQNIFAPSGINNTKTGFKGALRWLGFLPNDARYKLIASQSTDVDSDYQAEVLAPKIGPDGRYAGGFGIRFEVDPTEVFYGFGPDSRDENISGFTRRDVKGFITGGINFLEYFLVSYTERFRYIRLEPGGRALDLFIGQAFPGTPGVNAFKVISARGPTLIYDTRDNGTTPTRGFYGEVGIEASESALGSSFSFVRVHGQVKTLVPWPSNQWIGVVRLATSYVDNKSLPPYELSVLGGRDFRGYPDSRFIDRGVVKLNVEERIRMARLEVMRVPFDLEAAPFLEFGQVFDSPSKVALQETRVSYGMGLRAVVRPNVVGKVDIGAAGEGVNIFVGLDYPF